MVTIDHGENVFWIGVRVAEGRVDGTSEASLAAHNMPRHRVVTDVESRSEQMLKRVGQRSMPHIVQQRGSKQQAASLPGRPGLACMGVSQTLSAFA